MTSTKIHHNLKIKSEIGLKKILDIQMSIKKNHHGRLEVVGIPDKEIQEYLNTPLIDKDFILLTKDEQDKEEIVFSGIIEKIEQQPGSVTLHIRFGEDLKVIDQKWLIQTKYKKGKIQRD